MRGAVDPTPGEEPRKAKLTDRGDLLDHSQEKLQRQVLNWVVLQDTIENHESHEDDVTTITVDQVVMKYGIPRDYLEDYLESLNHRMTACKSLPLSLLMLFAYFWMEWLHDPIILINALEHSVVFDLEENAEFAMLGITEQEGSEFIGGDYGHKNIYEVANFEEFWSWLIIGYIPLIFGQEESSMYWNNSMSDDMLVEDIIKDSLYPSYGGELRHSQHSSSEKILTAEGVTPIADRGFYMDYNRIVGGVRIQQEISDEDCIGGISRLLPFYNRSCVGGHEYEIYPEMPGADRMFSGYGPSRQLWLYAFEDIDKMLSDMESQEVNGWLDRKTRKIEIALPLYNPELAVHSMVTCNFYFSRGGWVWTRVIPMSTTADWFRYGYIVHILVDMTWLFSVVYVFYEEVSEIRSAFQPLRGEDPGSVTKKVAFWRYANIWAYAAWFSIFVAVFVITQFPFRLAATWELNDIIGKLAVLANGDREEYTTQVQNYMRVLDGEVKAVYTYRMTMGAYPMFILLRLLKAFAAQPRLAVVTETLSVAGVDLAHFFVVFISVFATYVAAGSVLFGRNLDSFQAPSRAGMTSFRLMMGDFDWGDLVVVGRIEAGFWFGTFVVVVMLVMLNMLVAMIMEAYGQVKESTDRAPTLWQEVLLLSSERKARKAKAKEGMPSVTLRKILKVLKAQHPDVFAKSSRSLQGSMKEHQRKNRGNRRSVTSLKENMSMKTHSLDKMFEKQLRKSASDLTVEDIVEESYTIVTLEDLVETCGCDMMQAYEYISKAVEEQYYKKQTAADIEQMLQTMRKLEHRTGSIRYLIERQIDAYVDVNAERKEDDDGPTEGRDFLEELTGARRELWNASQWIDTEPADLGQHDCEAADVEESKDLRAEGIRETPVDPDNLWEGQEVYVSDDVGAVLDACRESHVDIADDDLRMALLGQKVTILDKGYDTCHIKLSRLPAFGNMTQAASASSFEDPGISFPIAGLKLVQMTTAGTVAKTKETMATKEKMFAEQITSGQKELVEALAQVEDLKDRLSWEADLKHRVASTVQRMKTQVTALTRQNQRLVKEAKDSSINVFSNSADVKLDDAGEKERRARDEYYTQVRKVADENHRLRAQLRFLHDGKEETDGSLNEGVVGK